MMRLLAPCALASLAASARADLLLLEASGRQEPLIAREEHRLAEQMSAPPTLRLLSDWEADREWDNWKINSDATVQVQNEQQVAVNPIDPDNLVAVWRDFRLGYRRVGSA